MRSAIAYLMLFVTVLAFGFARVRHGNAAVLPPPAAEESRTTPASAVPARGDAWLGILVAKQSVDVSPRVASLISAVKVRPGDVVKRGDILAVLDGRDRAQALRAASVASRSQAERAARTERLHEAALASDEDARSARFEAERRAVELDLARVLVDDAVVRAPFDGTIVARFVDPGRHVAAGAPMLRMIDPHGARVRFGVPPSVADGLRVGQELAFCGTGAGLRSGRATLTSVAAEVDRSAGLVVVEGDVATIGAFRSGSEVRVALRGEGAMAGCASNEETSE